METVGGQVAIDKQALRKRYREERDKRVRPDGNDQYVRIAGQLAHYLEDPYTPVTERGPRTGHVRAAFIGGGLAGLVSGAFLKQAGIDDVRIIEKGGDVGGTWYWNRYPGAQCDTASFIYMPLLEETGHMPTEKYAHAPEILEHCRRIAKQFGLYDNALFHTEVTDLRWEEHDSRWRIKTSRGDDFTASYVGMGLGTLHVPKLPGIPGLETFGGHSFHTSRWDYDYTGGDYLGAPMDRLRDKRVALIGTGATAVQVVPHLARACKKLYVFQRTPSAVDVRDNIPTDPDWFASIASPGWQQRWLENFTENQGQSFASEDLVMDGWTAISRRLKARVLAMDGDITLAAINEAFEDADLERQEEIRSRVDAIVRDHATAERLKAWYGQLCKRPCFHDEYLHAFNNANVTLVDTNGQGVERITEQGVVVEGVTYGVDCIIYASGFETSLGVTSRLGFGITGREGLTLAERWADGMRSLHGMHVHGFPNLFLVQPTQGANLIANIPHNLIEGGRTMAMIVKAMEERGCREVEVTEEAEDAWIDLLLSGSGNFLFNPDCTPGYYNNEGRLDDPRIKYIAGYPQGATAYFRYLARWRDSGNFEGLAFS